MNVSALDQQRYVRHLWLLLAGGAALRCAYVLVQPGSDPAWNRPILDGAIYLEWARALVGGVGGPTGAFYQAPLYPYALAAHLALFGERLGLLYLGQQALVIAAAALAARTVRLRAGPRAALAAAALLLLYAPTTYFAARPLAEALALLLLFGALAAASGRGMPSAAVAGVLLGLGVLARANLLLLPPLWAACEFAAGRRRRAGVVLAAVVLVVAPLTLRNRVVSGHWVPVAANAGLTAYHGNGPGAMGIFTQPAGFSGEPARQREEARVLASAAVGRPLDAVEADRWWGRRALETRLADPAGSLRLALQRGMLLLDSYEHGLDYPPAMDRNPLRLTLRFPAGAEIGLVPLGLLLGLAAAAWFLRGWRGSGGGLVWSTLLGCAATPLLFYVSSRYRLPAAALLTLPAAIGLDALWEERRSVPPGKWWGAVALGTAVCCFSLLVPSQALQRAERSAGWSNRASAWLRAGDLTAARRAADRAIALDPSRAAPRYNLGLILQAEGRIEESRQAYRDALARDPGLVPAAHRLALLLIDDGEPARALAVLRRTMLARPGCVPCWSDVVLARARMGDLAGARRSAAEARARGIGLDPSVERLLVDEGVEDAR